MKSLKRFIFAGIIVILAVSFVTCGADLSDDDEDRFITVSEDVMVSEDGGKVILYLDGEKAPRSASRAMQGDLAQMSYDFLEVIFVGSATSTARTSWELGQPAGISGVLRGVDYVNMSGAAGAACMFVGKKDGKTLLGVGKMTHVDGVKGTAATEFTITASTKYVTFTISPIQSGLVTGVPPGTAPGYNSITNPANVIQANDNLVDGVPAHHWRGVIADSFRHNGSANTTYNSRTASNSSLSALGGIQYPTYALPTFNSTTSAQNVVNATYTFSFKDGTIASLGAYFGFNQAAILGAIKHYGSAVTNTAGTAAVGATAKTTNSPIVQKRTPRYMENGHYMEPRNHVDTKTTVDFGDTTTNYETAANGTTVLNFNPVVPLVFTSAAGSTGIFSFYLQIPVYMVAVDIPANATRPNAEKWYIRTGMGSDLYSLDDGASSGGCVLMSIGSSSIDWLDIEWGWL